MKMGQTFQTKARRASSKEGGEEGRGDCRDARISGTAVAHAARRLSSAEARFPNEVGAEAGGAEEGEGAAAGGGGAEEEVARRGGYDAARDEGEGAAAGLPAG